MSSFIPAPYAKIFFNQDENGVPSHDVLVCDTRSRNIGTPEQFYMKQFKSTYGAVYKNWMIGEDRIYTPEGVFATVWLNSIIRPTHKALKAALREFSKIDQFEWARIMPKALEHDPEYGFEGEEPQYD